MVKKKKKSKKGKKRKPFGGYGITFKGRKESLEKVFGKKKLSPAAMTKALWKFVKSKRLMKK